MRYTPILPPPWWLQCASQIENSGWVGRTASTIWPDWGLVEGQLSSGACLPNLSCRSLDPGPNRMHVGGWLVDNVPRPRPRFDLHTHFSGVLPGIFDCWIYGSKRIDSLKQSDRTQPSNAKFPHKRRGALTREPIAFCDSTESYQVCERTIVVEAEDALTIR